MEIIRSNLTDFDLDVLSNMMLVFFHAGERDVYKSVSNIS
jgi:hypothetical protein